MAIYLADERELAAARGLPDGDQLDRGAGQPISGTLALALAPGRYHVEFFDPKTGLSTDAGALEAGAEPVSIAVPTFVHDAAVRVARA